MILSFVLRSTKHFLPTVAPRIDRKNLQKKVMRVGQMLRIEADVEGEPAPVVTWKLKDATLKNLDRLKIENEDYHTTFILTKIQRCDTGTYTVIAKNDSGTDQVEVEIQVRIRITLSKPLDARLNGVFLSVIDPSSGIEQADQA